MRWARPGIALLVGLLALTGVLAADRLAGPVASPPTAAPLEVPAEAVAGGAVCTAGLGPAEVLDLAREDAPTVEPDGPDADAPAPDADAPDADAPDADGQDVPEGPPAQAASPEGEPAGGGVSPAVTVARPGAVGDHPAAIEIDTFGAGELTSSALPAAFPGAHVRRGLRPDPTSAAAWVRWLNGPAGILRSRLLDEDDAPAGTLWGTCARMAGGTHVVPGLSTVGGEEARLRLANPFRGAATVGVRFLSPSGVEAPLILRNVTVPARGVRELVVNEVLPEREDLTAVVEVATGRVAVEGLQLTRAAIGGVDGASLLAASTQPREDWSVPWIRQDDQAGSWLWIANPTDRTAPVELTVHGVEGGQVPQGLAEVSVPPGQLRRVDLAGTLPDDWQTAGVTARSNGVPVVVSAATRVQDPEPERTGLAVQLGRLPATSWVVGGEDADERVEQLHLLAPGGSEARVDVTVFSGSTVTAPAQWQSLVVPAGSTRSLDLADELAGARSWSVHVRASEGAVVVGRVGWSEQGRRHLVAGPGASSADWEPEARGLAASRVEGLVRNLGTTADVVPPAAAGEPG